MSHQLCNSADIHARHHQPRGESVPVTVPGVVFKPRFFDRGFEPVASIEQPVSLGIEKHVSFSAALRFEGTKRLEGYVVQGEWRHLLP